jgi:hypothetical protein
MIDIPKQARQPKVVDNRLTSILDGVATISIGAIGLSVTSWSDVNVIAQICVGIATTVYISFKAANEIRKRD